LKAKLKTLHRRQFKPNKNGGRKTNENTGNDKSHPEKNASNFFDRTKNINSAFKNNFIDNGDIIPGLTWQKDGSSEGMIWSQAKEYINKLDRERFAGYSDWRLPTVEELASLMKSSRAKGNLYIHPVFSSKQPFCWSVDTFAPDVAWYASFKVGMIRHIYHFFYYARAVRSLQ